jgi:N-glycosylase/DNA lyase
MDGKWGSGKLPLTRMDLCLDHTLPSGQSFRWRKNIDKNEWHGVIHRQFYSLKQEDEAISFRCFPSDEKSDIDTLNNYFQTQYNLKELYDIWSTSKKGDSKKDINAAFAEASVHLPGLRLIRQDPHECLFSFICSQNNNIKRITQMIGNFCAVRRIRKIRGPTCQLHADISMVQSYGTLICEEEGHKYYTFPTLSDIVRFLFFYFSVIFFVLRFSESGY